MNLPTIVAIARFHYYGDLLDINNVLNQLGIRSDEKAEEIGKKHTMTIVNDIIPRLNQRAISIIAKGERS